MNCKWLDNKGLDIFNYARLDRLELEFNNTCFLYCGGCARTFNKKIIENKQVISLENIKKFFPPEFCNQLHYFLSCGNYGDPIAHPHCYEILEYFRINGTKNIAMSTNGSARDPEWWAKLGNLINGGPRGYHGGRVTFSIDGLADTNHLYKVGAKWERIMENAKAYIDAGGRARWQFIIMNHNEHQIEAAKALAKEMGFAEFVEKTSFRFIPVRMDQKHAEQLAEAAEINMLKSAEANTVDHSQEAIQGTSNKAGTIVESPINVPLNEKHIHPDRQKIKAMHESKTFWEEDKEIICQNRASPRIYVSADGKVWPCNWLGGVEFYEDTKEHFPLPNYVKHGLDNNWNSLYNFIESDNPVKAVLQEPWFTHLQEEDWGDPKYTPTKCKQMCHTKIGTGIFEKMRRNEIELKTGRIKDLSEIHGLSDKQGGSGYGKGAIDEID